MHLFHAAQVLKCSEQLSDATTVRNTIAYEKIVGMIPKNAVLLKPRELPSYKIFESEELFDIFGKFAHQLCQCLWVEVESGR